MNCPVNPAIEALLKPTHYNPLATDIQKWIRDMEILFDADGIPDVDTKQPFYAVNYITEDFRTEIEEAVKSAQEKSKDAQEKLKIVRAKSKSAQEESESVQEKLEGIQKEYEVAIYWPQFKRFMIEFDREFHETLSLYLKHRGSTVSKAAGGVHGVRRMCAINSDSHISIIRSIISTEGLTELLKPPVDPLLFLKWLSNEVEGSNTFPPPIDFRPPQEDYRPIL